MTDQQIQVRRWMTIIGTVVVLAMTYGSGIRARTKQIQKQNEDVKIFKQEARVAQLAAQGSDAQVQQLEARRLLDVARDDLSKSDTDGAKAAVTEAVARLKTAQSADAAMTADFTGMIDDLSNVSFGSVSTARLAVEGFAASMDETFAKVNSLPAPDALTKVTIEPPTANDKPTIGNDVTRTE